jgi:REP element-mobilizing transposase RayT
MPWLKKPIRQKIFDHIRENAKKQKIHIDTIGGHFDHVHALIRLLKNMTISQIMQLIKGESSFWINKNHRVNDQFLWQTEYYATSVSPQNLEVVRNYIKNQDKHHIDKTLEEELKSFYGLLCVFDVSPG